MMLDLPVTRFGRTLAFVCAFLLFGLAAQAVAQVSADRAAVEPRSIPFPAAVVEELEATGEAFLPGTGMSVVLGEGITAVVGVAGPPDEQLLIVDGVIAGLSTDETASRIMSSSEVEVMRPLAGDHPGAVRFGRPILLISTRNAPGRPLAQASPAPGAAVFLYGRNATSMGAGAAPLMILDGVIVASGDPGITPDRIDHIEIIKGAAAVELYGSRAANGIIRITTKK